MEQLMKPHKFELEIERRSNYFRVVIRDTTPEPPQHTSLNSELFTDTPSRRAALDGLFWNLGDLIRGRVFPADTTVYDVVEGAHGKIATNPHYPE